MIVGRTGNLSIPCTEFGRFLSFPVCVRVRDSPCYVAGGDALGQVAVCVEGKDAGVPPRERHGNLILGAGLRGPAVAG